MDKQSMSSLTIISTSSKIGKQSPQLPVDPIFMITSVHNEEVTHNYLHVVASLPSFTLGDFKSQRQGVRANVLVVILAWPMPGIGLFLQAICYKKLLSTALKWLTPPVRGQAPRTIWPDPVHDV